ncbi:MAG: hypothetical protein ACWGMZ_10125, partial [Thermoguttaceae bacterium]
MPWPNEMQARIFADENGEAFAVLSDRGYGKHQIVSFNSVLSDGIFVKTILTKQTPASDHGAEQIHQVNLAGVPIPDVYSCHCYELKQLSDERKCEVITFAPERFQEVIDYGRRL